MNTETLTRYTAVLTLHDTIYVTEVLTVMSIGDKYSGKKEHVLYNYQLLPVRLNI